jgi:4,5-DOPA dioxygenase extradiol
MASAGGAAELSPAYFVSHGTALHTLDPGLAPFSDLRAEGARALAATTAPTAVVVVSAHWVAGGPTLGVGSALAPETIHDHPSAHLYSFRYAARGDAALAAHVAEHLRAGGFGAHVDAGRGLDHGAWLALELLFPGAPLPVVPIQLPARAADAARLGASLAPLRAEGVALLFSGSATHNQAAFRDGFLKQRVDAGGGEAALAARRAAAVAAEATVATTAPWSVAFDSWLAAALERGAPAAARCDALLGYERAPGAAEAHPEPSHFLPAVAFAATGSDREAARRIASGFQYALSMSAWAF